MNFSKIIRPFFVILAGLIFITACHSTKLEIVFRSDEADSTTALGAPQIYHLKIMAVNADFPYDKLADIDSTFYHLDFDERAAVFSPVKGRFTYYQFLATALGEQLVLPGEDLPEVTGFHHILIIKTNDRDQIIDAYQYTKEWAESPFNYDLFRLGQTELTLKDSMNICDLKLTRTGKASPRDEKWEQQGFLKLPPLP